jgi:hypothetical protein
VVHAPAPACTVNNSEWTDAGTPVACLLPMSARNNRLAPAFARDAATPRPPRPQTSHTSHFLCQIFFTSLSHLRLSFNRITLRTTDMPLIFTNIGPGLQLRQCQRASAIVAIS